MNVLRQATLPCLVRMLARPRKPFCCREMLKSSPVAFKLSKRKGDDNLQLLHTILFGKKGKEKQRARVKEKLDRCVKDKLVDFCDLLNIPINKAIVRKEDLCAKLLDFLEFPHSTTDVILADLEQNGQKRKRNVTQSKPSVFKEAPGDEPEKKSLLGREVCRNIRNKHHKPCSMRNALPRKGKNKKKAEAEPGREEMHAVVVDILKEVDFNTATLSGILKQLGTHFGMDLMHRKAELEDIITEVINNMCDEEEGEGKMS